MLGPVDESRGTGRLRGKKHTSVPLPCLHRGKNVAMEFAKLVSTCYLGEIFCLS